MPQHIAGISNNVAEVKAAGVGAAAGDAALVVTLSPNNLGGVLQSAAATPAPVGLGGTTVQKVFSAASTNATNLKASPAVLYGVWLSNTNAAARYIHFYSAASITVGTTVPLFTLQIPANTLAPLGINFAPFGIPFGSALGFSLTTGASDTDAVAVAANEIVGLIQYA